MQNINLYQDVLRPRQVSLPAAYMAVALAVLVSGLVAAWGWQRVQLQDARVRTAQARAALDVATNQVTEARAKYPPPQADAALAATLGERQAQLARTRQLATRLDTGQLGNVHGLSVYLEGLARQHVEGTWLTGVAVSAGGQAIGLVGKTLLPALVPAYLERLADEPAFDGRAFSELELSTPDDGLGEIAFSVSTPGVDSGAQP